MEDKNNANKGGRRYYAQAARGRRWGNHIMEFAREISRRNLRAKPFARDNRVCVDLALELQRIYDSEIVRIQELPL